LQAPATTTTAARALRAQCPRRRHARQREERSAQPRRGFLV